MHLYLQHHITLTSSPHIQDASDTVPAFREQVEPPYVSPTVAATPTTYVLVPEQSTRYFATNIITSVSTAGRRNFTYNANYGGAGGTYYLAGHSTERNFIEYIVVGTWNP